MGDRTPGRGFSVGDMSTTIGAGLRVAWRGVGLTWRVDVLPMLVLLGVEMAGTFAAGHRYGHHVSAGQNVNAGAYAVVAVSAVALVARRRHPRLVLAVVFSASLAYSLADYPAGPIFLSLILAFFTAATRGHRRAAWAAIVGGFVSFSWLGVLVGVRPPARSFPGGIAGLAGWLAVLAVGAEVVRVRRERAAEATQARDSERARRASEERLRIARDLHDVIGHNISLINVQAGVGLDLMDQHPEQARIALAAIKAASKEALGELRSVLDALRRQGENAPRSPAPGLGRLEELLARSRQAGMNVTANIAGRPRPLPTGVDLAAYRIIQEALTNVARHAGPASTCVKIAYDDDTLTLSVEDDGRHPATNGSSPTGTGIAGMAERAAALGGILAAGPRPAGGFVVSACLPLGEAE